MTDIDHQGTAGVVMAIRAVLVALVKTHPNKRALLQELEQSSAKTIAAVATTHGPEESYREALRKVLGHIQTLLAKQIEEEGQ